MKKLLLLSLMALTLFSSAEFAQASKKEKENEYVKKSLVTVLSPNGGETYNTGQQMNISWFTTNSNPNMIARVYLVYTPTNISTTIASGPANGSFSYTIPTQLETMPGPLPIGEYYKIRVDIFNHKKLFASDLSNKNFTITTPTPLITLISPIGGEVYNAGEEIKISWTSVGVANVGILFCYNSYPYTGTLNCQSSPFSGINTIFPSFPNQISINIPNPWPGNEQTVVGKIRVYDLANPLVYSESSYLTITSSNFPG